MTARLGAAAVMVGFVVALGFACAIVERRREVRARRTKRAQEPHVAAPGPVLTVVRLIPKDAT